VSSEGETVQVALVASDGVAGLPTLLHNEVLPYQIVVPVTGAAVRVRVPALLSELQRDAACHARFLAYEHQQMAAMAQAAVCLRFHTVLQRLCRWLLTAADGLQGDTLDVTQDVLAQLLGTPRPVVSAAASALHDRGVIRQRRGRVRILQRTGLCARVCPCYVAPPLVAVRSSR
jgi:CRP-like cAMP-binding protein